MRNIDPFSLKSWCFVSFHDRSIQSIQHTQTHTYTELWPMTEKTPCRQYEVCAGHCEYDTFCVRLLTSDKVNSFSPPKHIWMYKLEKHFSNTKRSIRIQNTMIWGNTLRLARIDNVDNSLTNIRKFGGHFIGSSLKNVKALLRNNVQMWAN